jgi:hypothetical protein
MPMKIDIGNGKILGTKRVSPNGQVSGFTEYAGRDVLVILPEADTDVRPGPAEYLDELKTAVEEHMRLAFREYRGLRARFRSHKEAAAQFVEAHAPKSFAGLYEKVESWARDQQASPEASPGRAAGSTE